MLWRICPVAILSRVIYAVDRMCGDPTDLPGRNPR